MARKARFSGWQKKPSGEPQNLLWSGTVPGGLMTDTKRDRKTARDKAYLAQHGESESNAMVRNSAAAISESRKRLEQSEDALRNSAARINKTHESED